MPSLSADDELRAAVRAALAAGQSQTGLAAAAGYPQPKLSDWLAGKKAITLHTAERLALAAGVRLAFPPVARD